jgi:hypothetical protein
MGSKFTKTDLLQITDYVEFESFCHTLLVMEGYAHIEPLGGGKDKGRDAVHVNRSTGKVTIFAYSVRKDWEDKLDEDLGTIHRHGHACDEVVFLTNCSLTASAKDKKKKAVKEKYGWGLEFYDLERISTLVDGRHRELRDLHPQIFSISSKIVESEPDQPHKAAGVIYRVARESKKEKLLTERDCHQISLLYKAMWNSNEEVGYGLTEPSEVNNYLEEWAVPNRHKSEQIYFLATYEDHICGFVWGELHKDNHLFSIHVVVGPSNIRNIEASYHYPSPPTVVGEVTKTLLKKMLEELIYNSDAQCIAFEIDVNIKGADDNAPLEPTARTLSLLHLYAKYETQISEESITQDGGNTALSTIKAYILDMKLFVPGYVGDEQMLAPCLLGVVPLRNALKREFSGGQVPYASVAQILSGLYAQYYDWYLPGDLWGDRTKLLCTDQLKRYDQLYRREGIRCESLEDAYKRLVRR